MYTGRDTCALSKSLNFTCFCFFSLIVRYTQRNVLFFIVFQRRIFFLFSKNMFEHKWCPVFFHYSL